MRRDTQGKIEAKVAEGKMPSKPIPSEITSLQREVARAHRISEKEAEIWGDSVPKSWYRAVYSLVNSVFPHDPSENKFFYHWKIN